MYIKKREKIIGISAILVLLFIISSVYFYINRPKPLSQKEIEGMFIEETETVNSKEVLMESNAISEEKIVVEIKGEVKNPDVYTLEKGAIVKDLVNIAGGLTEKGDTWNINLAREIQEHECIIIYSEEDKINGTVTVPVLESGTVNNNSSSSDGKINLNSASESELKTLPGVGAVMAQKIIEYRDSNGGFKSIEELKNISRVGDITFEKLKEKIKI